MALVTSGLGPLQGGIGVVSRMSVDALRPHAQLNLWRHHHRWPRALRFAHLSSRALLGTLRRPDFVFYEHVGLARIHSALPVLRGIPYGLFIYGIDVWRPLGDYHREALLGARIVLACSEFTARRAREYHPWLPEARVTWLGVPALDVDESCVSPEPTALIVGRMVGRDRLKGHDLVLDAWPEIRRAVPRARLIVVGDGPDRPRLMDRVRREAIAGVEFRGWIGDAERDRLYRSSRLFLLPSLLEGFGLVVAEAAVAGVPVLGLRGTVIEELFPEGQGAVLADEPTGRAVAAAAIPLLADPDRATAVGAAARARVNETFLEHHFAARFKAAILPLLHA